MGIRILKGGMLTTVQDSGRPGYQSQGFGVSGVMDRRSFKIANLLLDNRKMKQFSNSLFLDQHWNLLPRRSSLSREVIFSRRSTESL